MVERISLNNTTGAKSPNAQLVFSSIYKNDKNVKLKSLKGMGKSKENEENFSCVGCDTGR